MSLWFMRIWVGIILVYISYIAVMVGLHTVCDCLQ